MSKENGKQKQKMRVKDPEDKTSEKIKTRILKARERVDQVEEAIFVDATINPEVGLTRPQQVQVWSNIVKQYLRAIEPLLRSDEVEGATKYYEQVEIAQIPLYPPDTDGYQFSLVGENERDESTLKRIIGLPRHAELPRPREATFYGLKDIIEKDPIIQERWNVCVDARGAPPHEYVHPTIREPVPKSVYVDAVRHADRFLQQAGVGLELESGGTDIIRGFDQSGDNEEAEFDNTEYRGDPGI